MPTDANRPPATDHPLDATLSFNVPSSWVSRGRTINSILKARHSHPSNERTARNARAHGALRNREQLSYVQAR